MVKATSVRTKWAPSYPDQKQCNSKFSSKVRLWRKSLDCHCLWAYVCGKNGVLNVWFFKYLNGLIKHIKIIYNFYFTYEKYPCVNWGWWESMEGMGCGMRTWENRIYLGEGRSARARKKNIYIYSIVYFCIFRYCSKCKALNM